MKRRAPGVILLAMFSGCAVGPDYKRPDVEVASAYKEAGEWKLAQPQDDLDRGRWWQVFGDPQLNALVEQVEISNQKIGRASCRERV